MARAQRLWMASHIVADKQHGAALVGNLVHFSQALLLKCRIADGQHFVDDEDFGLEVGGDGEGEADVHAAGVKLHGGIDEFLDFGEGDDFVEFPGDFGAFHAEDRAVEEDVFAAGQFAVKAGADFEEAGRRGRGR